jgi:hypothetical protein
VPFLQVFDNPILYSIVIPRLTFISHPWTIVNELEVRFPPFHLLLCLPPFPSRAPPASWFPLISFLAYPCDRSLKMTTSKSSTSACSNSFKAGSWCACKLPGQRISPFQAEKKTRLHNQAASGALGRDAILIEKSARR